MDFGISTTFAVSTVNEVIERTARRFLSGINYRGVSEVEFMYDPDDGAYKLIEVNPRTWKWHSITNKLGLNLIRMMVDSYSGNRIRQQENNKEGVGWIESITDTYVVVTELFKGNMTFNQYLQTIRREKEFACFDWHDPLPAFSYMLMLPYLFLTR
jgi:predicted ATP-grasp superfamily ATP-dependent carboligase